MRKAIWAASAAAMALVSTAAWATVTFNTSTGTGFVGKGDVQVPFGWNNQTAQGQIGARNLSFEYDTVDTYDVTCDWTTETGGPNSKTVYHDVTIPKHVSVNGSVAYDARNRNQITGINLNGFGPLTYDGTVPVEGGPCPGNNPGTISVGGVVLTGTTGGLYVSDVTLGVGPALIY